MGKSLLDLASSLEKRVLKLEKEASKLADKVAETILVDLVIVTPVDTSNALSNWQIGLGRAVPAPIPPWFPGSLGSTEAQSENAAIFEGNYRLRLKKPGQPIYISNLVDYIVDLNRGSSMQAPSGFVERAVMKGKIYAKEQKLRF